MREILFRGKKPITKDWVYGTGLLFDGINTWIVDNPSYKAIAFGQEQHIAIPETVGQYTGLTDKNGKKIFEGDIVNVNTKKDSLCNSYKGRNLVIKFDEYHRFVASGSLEYPLCNHYEWEVIGNIHDNPGLLRGEE